MTCPVCGNGELVDGTTTFSADVEGTLLVVRNVPALVCDVCGEPFIDDAVAEELEASVADAHTKGTESLVRHYEPVAS